LSAGVNALPAGIGGTPSNHQKLQSRLTGSNGPKMAKSYPSNLKHDDFV
jgi:hypothetical protein